MSPALAGRFLTIGPPGKFQHVWLFCDSMDCSPPGSSDHGISRVRILEWVAISSSRGASRPRNWTHVSYVGRWILYHWATWAAQEMVIPKFKSRSVSHWSYDIFHCSPPWLSSGVATAEVNATLKSGMMSNVLTDVSLWLPQCSSQLSHVCWLNNCVFIRALWFILGKKPNVKTTWSYCYGGDLGDNNSGKGKSGWVRTHGRFQKAEGKMVSIGGQWFICLFYFESLYEYFPGFPWGSAGEESACNVGYLGLIPGLWRPPGEGKGFLLQYSGLENPMDVHWVAKSQTWLSDFHSFLWILYRSEHKGVVENNLIRNFGKNSNSKPLWIKQILWHKYNKKIRQCC